MRSIIEKWLDPFKEMPCPSCTLTIDEMHSYCRWCGAKNPKFNRELFDREWGMIPEEAIKECPSEHEVVKRDAKKKGKPVEYRFCMICGERALP